MENFRDQSADELAEFGSASYFRTEWAETSVVAPRRTVARKRLVIIAPEGTERNRASAELRREFRSLCKAWRVQTQFLSDSHEVVLHRAYQRIIGLGAPAVPLVMEELEKRGGDWFWALCAMTGKDPTRPEDWGNFQLMKSAWLGWWTANSKTFG